MPAGRRDGRRRRSARSRWSSRHDRPPQPYPEVLDSLLTSLVGGVAAEEHPFPPPGPATPPFRQLLERPPAVDVVAVYGARDGESHLFRKDVDYTLLPDGTAIEWPAEGAEYPDAGTLVEINYVVRAPGVPVTDLHVGSVARTLAESVALEIAGLYAQLEAVYDSAFVDTATGSSLDNVVALLGIERVRGGRPAGEIEFTRAPGSPGTITIPAGTRVITADGNVEYETTDDGDARAGPEHDPRRRPRPRGERAAPRRLADRAAGADRGDRRRHEPRADRAHARRTRPTRSCARARRASCTAASARRWAR